MLEARGITLGYPGAPPLIEDLDFTLSPGEMVALSGANGTGKSSLCLALAGLVVPSAGAVAVDGEPCLPQSAARARVAMLFQDPDSQLVTTSVEAEVAFPLENLGWDPQRREERVARLLGEFDLEHLCRRAPERLSGGEKSRLALASALAAEPGYLILDEPGVYLDEAARRRLRDLLAREQVRGLGILWVTQLEEEWAAAGRRLVLRDRALRPAPAGELRAAAPDVEPLSAGPPGEQATGPARLLARGLFFSYPNAPVPVWASRPAGVGRGEAVDPSRRAGRSPSTPPPVLRGLDLEVHAGETVLIGGESGSGKTTLLLLLSGVLDPGAGAVTLASGSVPGAKSHTGPPLGVLLQSPEDQLVCPTVLQDVALGPRLAGRGEREAEAEAMRALGVAGLDAALVGGLPPAALSHGQRRRAAWAGIWALGTRLWLLDEPTAGLDEEGVEALRRAVREFTSAGGSAILVTQDPRLIWWTARRLQLVDGQLVQACGLAGEPRRGPFDPL